MKSLLIGLLLFGAWVIIVSLVYWFWIRKLSDIADQLTPGQRIELLKTRRQRYLDH